MNLLVLLLYIFTFSLVNGDICATGYLEVHFIKKTGNATVSETFSLRDPISNQLLYTSPQFQTNMKEEHTVCVLNTEFSSYLLSFSQPEWNSRSYLTILTAYNTVAFKSHHDTGNVLLVLYTPLPKDSDWFLLSNREIHWTDLEWSQRSTQKILASSIATTANAKRIFVRKVLRAPSTQCAAYEVKVKYKHGVVVYVNGYEVFRDNMSSGLIESTSVNVNSYNNYEYRGPVRNGYELGTGNFVIAIEIHADETITDFDCWLSVYGSTWNIDSPLVYYYPVDVAYIMGDDPYDLICDYYYDTIVYTTETIDETYLEFDIGLGQVNAFLYYIQDGFNPFSKVQMIGRNIETNRWSDIMDRTINVPVETENVYNGQLWLDNFDKIQITVFDLVPYSGWTELRPVLRPLNFERDSPSVDDLFFEFKKGQTIQERLQDATYFNCESIGATPYGVVVTKECALMGNTNAVGSYVIPVIAFDYVGPQDFFVYLTIISDEQSSEVYYDTSYKVTPIVFTVIFCIIILILAIFAILIQLQPSLLKIKKSKKLKRTTPL